MPQDRVRRPLALLFVLLLATGASSRQATPAEDVAAQDPAVEQDPAAEQDQQPIFRAEINFVRVDAIVTDRDGNPVTDLEASDFEVFENGRPQTIESFRLVRVGEFEPDQPAPRPIRSPFDVEAEAARDDVRLIAIFLDDYHVRVGASMAVRDPLITFIRTQLGPGDLVALMYPLTPLADLNFTRNHDAVAAAIERFQGRKYDYTPRNFFEEQYAYYPAVTVERIRNEVSLSALRSLMVHLGGLREGRKSVILVSEGYTNSLPPQLNDPIAAMPGIDNPARRSPMADDVDPRAETMRFFAQTDLLSDLREVYDTANRNNTAIYALDPRGTAPFEFDIDQGVGFQTDRQMLTQMTDTLRILADQTDGRAIVARNDLEAGLRQVTRDSSVYYLLGYTSEDAPSDGKFHEIRVRVNRPRVEVRARPGYWAVTPEDATRLAGPAPAGPPPEVTSALSAIAEPPGVRFVRTWIGTSRGEAGRTRVTFVWEPAPVPAGARRDPPARVSLMAMGDGAAYFRGRVPDITLAAVNRAGSGTGADAQGSGGPARVVFDADPGRLQLRLSVEGDGGNVLDTDFQEFDVPDFGAPDVTLSTPAVLRARTAREAQALMGDSDAVPTTGRTFSRTERLLVRFEAYAPGGTRPDVSARLLNRAGGVMTDLSAAPAPAGGSRHQVDLPLAGLAAGEYLLEIIARAEHAGEARTLMAFRVTS